MIQDLKGSAAKTIEHVSLDRITTTASSTQLTREPFLHRMRLFHGSFSNESYWKILIRPFFCLINPAVLWSTLVIAFTTLWVIGIAFLVAEIYAPPPFLLNAAEIGYISAGPVVGGLLGCVICGSISDPIARYLTSKNNGIYEPEFRLPIMVGVPVTCSIGYFLLGKLLSEGAGPVVASVLWGLVFISVQVVAVSTGAYIVDAYRDISVDIFIIAMSVKNFIWFGFTCQ